MKWLWLALAAAGVAAGLVGCAPDTTQIPEPTEEMALGMGVRKAELDRGHATYMEHCNRCHQRVPPGTIDPEFWRGIVHHMALRSRIGEVEERELLVYLMAAHGTVHGLDLEH